MNKEPWVTCCVNHERRERREAVRDADLIYLGNEFEIAESDGEYRLVPTRDHLGVTSSR